jgi:dCMP deaminase
MALLVATRATCARRAVGCVLVDSLGHVLSTGYNGVAQGEQHCTEFPCEGASYPSGQGLEKCEAIHAEQNALLQCKDNQAVHTCYTTSSPCVTCVKLLLNTSCKKIAFVHAYAEPHYSAARGLWVRGNGALDGGLNPIQKLWVQHVPVEVHL